MDRAGFGVALAGVEMGAGYGTRVAILAGAGNNGGDGYVAARYLKSRGAAVVVHALGPPRADTPAARAATLAQAAGIKVTNLAPGANEADLVVDAVFGVGFRGEVPGDLAAWADRGTTTLAVDIPSGLDADTGIAAVGTPVAAKTVTFHSHKPGHLLGDGPDVCGQVVVVDIGLHRGTPVYRLCEARDAPRPARRRSTHKWNAGSVAVVGGAPGMVGAPQLAAKGALAMGAGAVSLFVPSGLASGYAAWPELMTKPVGVGERFEAGDAHDVLEGADRYDVMVLGPGLGSEQQGFVSAIVAGWSGPNVIDADGHNAWAGIEDLAVRKGRSVITPHAGEFSRLTGRRATPDLAAEVARDAGLVLLLKGNPTVIAAADAWLVTAGGPELATIGTGDVLSGALAALWARGLDADVAARSAAFWHGIAGADLARSGAFSAGDLAGHLARYAAV
jgi:NAD(P)H-hydrate epimerase